MRLQTTLFGENFAFASVKDVLAKANEPRSGDRQAGLAASSMREMGAAKLVLAEVTMKELGKTPRCPTERTR
ncbi:MAG: ethanolamine ammonia-lyase subunit EutB [Polyangiales bacterium]